MKGAWETWLNRVGADALPGDALANRIVWRRLQDDPADAAEPDIVWLGHASFRIRWRGVVFLLDPVFRSWIGLSKRRVPKPPVARLRQPVAVVISHAHMDHLDSGTLAAISPDSLLLPTRTERFLSRRLRDVREIVSVRPGESVQVGPLEVRAFRSAHGGWRYPWQKGYVACSYLVTDGSRSVFWAGDTAYQSRLFAEVASYGDVDVALLPIGAYSPRWFLQKRHMNPVEAAQAARDLGARLTHPYHFGGYRLSLEPWDEPLRWFARSCEQRGVEWRIVLPDADV